MYIYNVESTAVSGSCSVALYSKSLCACYQAVESTAVSVHIQCWKYSCKCTYTMFESTAVSGSCSVALYSKSLCACYQAVESTAVSVHIQCWKYSCKCTYTMFESTAVSGSCSVALYSKSLCACYQAVESAVFFINVVLWMWSFGRCSGWSRLPVCLKTNAKKKKYPCSNKEPYSNRRPGCGASSNKGPGLFIEVIQYKYKHVQSWRVTSEVVIKHASQSLHHNIWCHCQSEWLIWLAKYHIEHT